MADLATTEKNLELNVWQQQSNQIRRKKESRECVIMVSTRAELRGNYKDLVRRRRSRRRKNTFLCEDTKK